MNPRHHIAALAAETAMASVNCGSANVTRAQAEKLRLLHPHGTGDPLDRDQSAGSPVVISARWPPPKRHSQRSRIRVGPSQIGEHRNKRRPREVSFRQTVTWEPRHVQARFDRAARARARRLCRAGADFNFSRRHPRPCGSPHVVRPRHCHNLDARRDAAGANSSHSALEDPIEGPWVDPFSIMVNAKNLPSQESFNFERCLATPIQSMERCHAFHAPGD